MTDIGKEIERIREELGESLVILGHHYQRASVLRHADEIGDSLELSRKAAARSEAERIVFCGVRFMAESAAILGRAGQTVYMPDMSAGCPMANMATRETMEEGLALLSQSGRKWLPVVYVNSSAEVKACCGRHGGSTCTSSNAARVFEWAFKQDRCVFFLPDEHLGVNTAVDLGIPAREVACYDRRKPNGGLSDATIRRARVIVWKGFCIVHQAFPVDQLNAVRERIPQAKVIVHPEVPREVVALADAHGSTSQIIKYVESAPEGSVVIVGTELNLVQRLAEEHKGRVDVRALAPSVCANMAKTNEKNLLAVLKDWPERNAVHVPEDVAGDARMALQRMLRIG